MRKEPRCGQDRVHHVTRSPNTGRSYGFDHSDDDAYGYTRTRGARIMPSGRSRSFWTAELSSRAMERRVCYDRDTGRALVLTKLLSSCRHTGESSVHVPGHFP